MMSSDELLDGVDIALSGESMQVGDGGGLINWDSTVGNESRPAVALGTIARLAWLANDTIGFHGSSKVGWEYVIRKLDCMLGSEQGD